MSEVRKEQFTELVYGTAEGLKEERTERKRDSIKLHEFLKHSKRIDIREQTLRTIHNCDNRLVFAVDSVKKDTKKQIYGESCNNRFCPNCSKRYALKMAQCIYAISNYLIEEKGADIAHIVLTQPNVIGSELEEEIKEINRAVDRLFKRKNYQDIFFAHIVKLEITYNQVSRTYHPHVHILAYFKDNDLEKYKLNRETLLNDWKRAKRDSRITQVFIDKVDKNQKGEDSELMKGVFEIAKYSAKTSEYLGNTMEVFETFYTALKGKRLLRFNGEANILKKIYEADRYGLMSKYEPKKDENVWFDAKLTMWFHFVESIYKDDLAPMDDYEIRKHNQEQVFDSYKDYLSRKKEVESYYNATQERLDEIRKRIEEKTLKRFKTKEAKEKSIKKDKEILKGGKKVLYKHRSELKTLEAMESYFRWNFQGALLPAVIN